MSVNASELRALLRFAVSLAKGAGEITLGHFRNLREVARKADGTLVTAADREAESYLRARIEKRFSADAIIGEEQGERRGSSGRCWIIDPLDGTYSFARGIPLYGVLIGLEIDGEPALGVVNLPALGEMLWAARGLGCTWNGKPACVSRTASAADALLVATDFMPGRRGRAAATMTELQRRFGASRTWGDCYGHVLVATGRADVAVDPEMKIWDNAALLPILEEAGGTFTDWRGRRTIRGRNAVSTNRALFDQTLRILAKA
jgi:histidinol-phosphatase